MKKISFAQRKAAMHGLRGSLFHGRLVLQRNVGILRNHLRNRAHRLQHRIVIIALAQVDAHLPADIAHLAIRQDAFKSVPNVNAVLVIVHGQQQQHAAIRALLAHVPFVFELVGPVGHVFPVQIMYGDHSHLRIGRRVVQFAANPINPRNSIRRKHMPQVAHVVGGVGEVLDALGGGPNGTKEEG